MNTNCKHPSHVYFKENAKDGKVKDIEENRKFV